MSTPTPKFGVSRRTLLTGAFASTAVAGLGLTACSPGDTTGTGAATEGATQAAAEAVMPQYQAFAKLPTPDLAGTEYVPNYYFSYPEDRPKSVDHPMGSGGDLTAFILTYSAPPTPMDSNPYWQFINEKLGVTLRPDMISADDYQSKFATLSASGDLPDVTQVVTYMKPPRMDALVNNAFEDITDIVSGDKILKWPNLAALPTGTWQAAMLGGRIWGVPALPQPFTSGLWVREDLSQDKGIKELPKTREDFVSWCDEMTDPSSRTYALSGWAGGSPVWIPNTVWGMFKVPNRYRLDGDKLVKMQETEEYLEAIEFTKELWDKGYMHPDSPTMTSDNAIAAFWQGTVIAYEGGFGSYWNQAAHVDTLMSFRVPYAADGTNGVHHQGTTFSVSGIKKGSDKVEEILNVMDWLNAPFGSQEHFENRYGPEGVTHEIVDGQPADLPDSEALRALNTIFIASGTEAMFTSDPQLKPHYERWYHTQKAIEPMLLADPTVGFYAEADSKSGALDKAIDDAQGDYIMGRRTLDEFKQVIADWRGQGGAEICRQYEEAIQNAG